MRDHEAERHTVRTGTVGAFGSRPWREVALERGARTWPPVKLAALR